MIEEIKLMPKVTLDMIRHNWADMRAEQMIDRFKNGWKKLQEDYRNKLENSTILQSGTDVQINLLKSDVIKLLDKIMPESEEFNDNPDMFGDRYCAVVDCLIICRNTIIDGDPDFCLETDIETELMENEVIAVFGELATLKSLPNDVFRLLALFMNTKEEQEFDYAELAKFVGTTPAEIPEKIDEANNLISERQRLCQYIRWINKGEDSCTMTVELNPETDGKLSIYLETLFVDSDLLIPSEEDPDIF